MKNKPVRTCIVCRKEGEKNDFLRIVRMPDGKYVADPSGKMNGRGAYVCKNAECVNKLRKTRALNRTFKCEISDEVYTSIEEAILGKKE